MKNFDSLSHVTLSPDQDDDEFDETARDENDLDGRRSRWSSKKRVTIVEGEMSEMSENEERCCPVWTSLPIPTVSLPLPFRVSFSFSGWDALAFPEVSSCSPRCTHTVSPFALLVVPVTSAHRWNSTCTSLMALPTQDSS